jgi:hypothetical protein
MSTRPTRPPSPRQRVEAARAKDPPPRLRRDPRGSLMSPVQDRPAHRVTSCGRNPRTKKGRRPVRPLHGGAARNRPDPIVLPAAAPAPIRVPARCRLTPGFLGDFALPVRGGHLFSGVACSSLGHVPTDASSALNGTGAGPIDAEVRRWETRSAQACGLWPKSPAWVSLQGARRLLTAPAASPPRQ